MKYETFLLALPQGEQVIRDDGLFRELFDWPHVQVYMRKNYPHFRCTNSSCGCGQQTHPYNKNSWKLHKNEHPPPKTKTTPKKPERMRTEASTSAVAVTESEESEESEDFRYKEWGRYMGAITKTLTSLMDEQISLMNRVKSSPSYISVPKSTQKTVVSCHACGIVGQQDKQQLCIGYLSKRFKSLQSVEFDPRDKSADFMLDALMKRRILSTCHHDMLSVCASTKACLVCRVKPIYRSKNHEDQKKYQSCGACHALLGIKKLFHALKVLKSVMVDLTTFDLCWTEGETFLTLEVQTDALESKRTLSYFIIRDKRELEQEIEHKHVHVPKIPIRLHKRFNLTIGGKTLYNVTQQVDVVRSYIIWAIRRWPQMSGANVWKFFGDGTGDFNHHPEHGEEKDWEYMCDMKSQQIFELDN